MIFKRTDLSSLQKAEINVNKYTIKVSNRKLIVEGDSSFIFGLGERFSQVNQKGLVVENKVTEQFCNQGDKTYFPLPFFILEDNTALFINTKRVFNFEFTKGIEVDITPLEDDTEVVIFSGTVKETIKDFISVTGEPLLPPKWVLGPWMSAHRWNSQNMIMDQVQKLRDLDFPITSLVIEQWSDEATFYNFNKAEYEVEVGSKTYDEYDFTNNTLWPNPKQMVEDIHAEGIKVLLWQAPVVKELEPKDEFNLQHKIDQDYLTKKKMVVSDQQEAYTIPKGNWFPDSMIPDFTNPDTIKWWFDKRQYLSDIGIDGYKTDGGEFVHSVKTNFHSGETGLEMVNDYSRVYVNAYKENLSDEQVLFSRAGYIGQQSLTMQWSGDQKSTWSELQSVYNAGLSMSLSGQHLWSFDIGGFAGDLPSAELYIRSTQLAVFSPIMQFHSEPIGGQFALLDPSEVMNNERSPWNIAEFYDDSRILEYVRKLYWLRMNLVPYIYSELQKSVNVKSTLMKHMAVDFSNEPYAYKIDRQHILGDLIVVPVLESGIEIVNFYLPEGNWVNIFTKKKYAGSKFYSEKSSLFDMFVFVQEGKGIVTASENLFDKMSNNLDPEKLYIHLYGDSGSYTFIDNEEIKIEWDNKKYKTNAKENIVIIFE